MTYKRATAFEAAQLIKPPPLAGVSDFSEGEMFKLNTHENYSAHLKWLAAHFEEALCAGLLLVLAVLAFANILVRYLSNFSFAFTEELEVSGLVYLTFFGAAAAFRGGFTLACPFSMTASLEMCDGLHCWSRQRSLYLSL
jgi:hypothetical protein